MHTGVINAVLIMSIAYGICNSTEVQNAVVPLFDNFSSFRGEKNIRIHYFRSCTTVRDA